MADNVAQSIKDLQKDLSQLDKQVLSTKEGWDALVNTVVKGMEKSGASVRDLYKEVSSKASAKDVLKIQAVLEFDKKQLQEDINKIQNAIKIGQGSLTLNGKRLRGTPAMKSALAELQNQMRAIPKSGAEAYDVIYRVVERYNTARQKTIEKNDKILSQLIKEEEREKAITREIERRQAKERNKLVSSNTSARLADEKRATQMINAEYKSRERYAAEREKYIRNLESTNHLARMRDEQRSTQMINAEYRKREKEAERHKRQIESTNRSLESMLPTLRRLASAFGVAFSVQGLVQFGKKLVETRGEFELQQVALRSILQNKQLADEIWDKTMQAALQSPFKAMQLVRYTKQLAAYRIETDKLFDTTKRLADVSAGLGVDMGRLILAYGQVKAANYLRASEIRQFTEAGVNVLGELRDYFNEVKGMSVGTAKVMDMVQKRLVTFSDVEAIFKRMTEQGGIFYNMQYIQSQTVKGQINKLHDAYDQMLNSIGKANEGVIKDFVAALNNIVKNWRSWAVALKSIGWAAAIGFIVRTTRVMSGLGTVSVGTLRRMASLKATIASFANAPTLVTAAITALVTTMIGLDNRMREANKQIDEQNLRLFESRNNFADLKSKIEENNKTIRENRSTTETLNKAQNDNRAIINKLKEEYPDLAEQMGIATNGIIEMNGAIDMNIRKLNEQMTLISLMKQGGWLEDTGKENLEEFEADLSTITARLMTAQAAARTRMMNLEISGDTTSDEYQTLKKISELDLSGNILGARDAFLELAKSMGEYSDSWLQNTWFGRWAGKVQTVGKTNYKSMKSGFGIDIDDLFYPFDEKNVKAKLDELSAPLKEYYLNGIKDNEEYMKEVNEQYGGDITKWITRNADKINQGTLDGINKANATLIKVLNPSTPAMREYINKYYNELWGLIDKAYLERLEQQITLKRSELMRNWTIGLQSEVDAMEAELERKRNGVDLTSTAEGKGTDGEETPEEKKAKIDAAWRRRISLLEEMKKRYDELSKSAYGYAKSESTVRGAFDESFKEIFKGTGISMSQIDFTSMQGMFASMRLALQQARGISEAVREEIMKKIDSYEAQITINAQVRIREDFGRQMEEAFGNYELTLELQKLNIPDDVAKDLFPDFDAETLGDLQGRMRMFLKEQGENFDEDDLKKYEEWSKKVESEILKYRKDKAKQYSKYLEKEYSDRAKLQMQYAKDVAFVTANFKDEKQRDNIIKNIDKKFQDDLNELNWKSFKESDFYVEMMEDISSLPAEYTQMMLDKLNEILENPETLLPRALKEATNARQKVLEAQIATQPIKLMSTSLKEIRDAAKDLGGKGMLDTKKRVDEEIVSVQREINEYNELIVCLQNTQGEMKAYEDAVKSTEDAYGGLTLQTRRAIDMLGETHALGMFQNKMEENQKAIDEINEKEEAGGKLDSADRQRRARLQAENSLLAAQIKLINDWIEAKRKEEEIRNRQAGTEAEYKRDRGETSSDVGEQITSAEEERNKREIRVQELKGWQKSFSNFAKAFEKWNGELSNVLNKFASMGNSLYDMYDALGGETNALTEGWKEFGNTITQTITSALALIPNLVTGFISAGTSINAALGFVGLIAEAVQLVATAVTALAKLNDSYYEKEIEEQQKKIDALRDAYSRLEKQIEKTWTTIDYMNTYEQQVENIRAQIRSMEAQLAAERDKKNTDDNAVRQYQRDIQDAYDQLEELEQKSIEVFGGIGEEGYRSAAQGFVEAWKSAFLETGDGLQGLQDHFDEFLQNWFVNQATMRIAGGMLEPVFRQIDSAVDAYGEGGTSAMLSEIERVRDMAAAIFPDLSLALEDLAGMFGVGGEGSLSGLAAGIQGMTEEQANILEAYWNSVRMNTASIDMNVSRIAEMLGAGGPNTNPMLTELKTISSHTRYIPQIYTLLTGTRRNLGNGQGFVTYNQ